MPLGTRPAADPYDFSRFQAIFACAPECVKLIDANGCLLDMNAAGLRMIDAPSIDAVRGRNILDLIAPAYRQPFSQAIAAVFEGKAVRLQFEVVGLSGRRLWMDQSASPLFERNGGARVLEMVAVTRDITAERQAETELIAAKVAEEIARSRADFAAQVSHEFNDPLNDVIGYSELLQETAAEQGRHDDAADLQRVVDAARRLQVMMVRMAALSLPRPNDSDAIGACDLRELMEDAIASVRGLCEATGNRLAVELPRERQIWQGDTQRLDLCLRLLLSNAARLTRRGSIIARLRTQQASSAWIGLEVAVTDIGAEPAPVGARANPRPPRGFSEAGLALAKQLAGLLGGELACDETRDEFVLTLRLPVHSGVCDLP